MVFQVAAVQLLPLVLGIDGVWLSIVVAELASFLFTLCFLKLKQPKFGY